MINKHDDYDTQKAQGMAEEYGKNASAEDVKNVQKNMGKMNRGPLAKIWDKVTVLWNAFNSSETPSKAKALIIGGLIYMISPIDLVPDIIPILGLTDDATVLAMIYNQYMQIMSITNSKK